MTQLPPIPPAQAEAVARAVLTDPARCAASPSLRALAWLTMKSARGQTVRQSVLNAERDRRMAS